MTNKTKDNARTYSQNISRERQKETGEIFTPQHLVDKMIDRLGPEAMQLGYTIFEPAAGDGNFVARIIERKIEANMNNGMTLREIANKAVRDVYACEYMKDNRAAIVRRIGDLLIGLGIFADRKEWTNSTERGLVRGRIAYCNTIDPWDTSEGREYPKWLFEKSDMSEMHPQWIKMREKSKNYKTNKYLHLNRDAWANEEKAKVDNSGEGNLSFLF